MEHLTKQQIVLLTLLVSFVTSLSTGIVTVSLMDQAPAGVTRTINQVIEKTIEQSAPQNASVGTVSINVDDQVALATAQIASSTVKIQLAHANSILGLGLIISKNGLIIVDKSIIDPNQSYVALLSDGSNVPLSINTLYQTTLSNPLNDAFVAFMPTVNVVNGSPIAFIPARISSQYDLGQKIFSLTGTSSQMLSDGLISEASSSMIVTSIPQVNYISGTVLFDIKGNVLGIEGSSSQNQSTASFSPIAPFIPASSVL